MMDTNNTKSLECQHCKKTFSQKSSLVRHLKLCTRPRPTSLRQKSCRQCSHAKAKCNLLRPQCSRCSMRGETCTYLTAVAESGPENNYSPGHEESLSSSNTVTPHPATTTAEPLEDFLNRVNEPLHSVTQSETLNVGFPNILQTDDSCDFLGPLHGESDLILCDPWSLNTSDPRDTTPLLSRHSMEVLLRVFRTWPSMLAKGFQYPPIFHHSMMAPMTVPKRNLALSLANCCTLVRMWYGQQDGTSVLVQDIITKEIKTIIANFRTFDEKELLGACQAMVMYIIMLIFPTKHQIAIPTIDPALFTGILQVVYHTASTGLILKEESDHTIPSYQTWIHITSKRRAIFSLYMLHWSYSVYHRLQSFNCSELGFMPAPPAKFLWEASEEKWEPLYKKWLDQWDGDEILQHEFGEVKPGVMLDERTEKWLEDADELGILFSTIFNATSREPEFMQAC